jgi:hypothetical protein
LRDEIGSRLHGVAPDEDVAARSVDSNAHWTVEGGCAADSIGRPRTPAADAIELVPLNAITIPGTQLPPDLPQYLLVIQNLSDTEEGEYRVEIEE